MPVPLLGTSKKRKTRPKQQSWQAGGRQADIAPCPFGTIGKERAAPMPAHKFPMSCEVHLAFVMNLWRGEVSSTIRDELPLRFSDISTKQSSSIGETHKHRVDGDSHKLSTTHPRHSTTY